MDWEWYTSPAGEKVRRLWVNVLNGSIPLSALDDTEIGHVRLKDANGKFSGPKPYATPTTFNRFRREMRHRYELKMAEVAVNRATEVMIEILDSSTATATEKLRASQYIQERTFGKVADKIEVLAEVKPWEGTVAGILTDGDEDDSEDET